MSSPLASSTSQSEWILRKRRHMQRLPLHHIAWQKIMLYHRRKFLLVVCFLIGTLFFRANLPSSATQSHLRTENKKLLPFPPSPADLDRINAEFTDPDQLLLWASQQFPNPSLVQVTSFGPSGLVLLHKMHRLGLLSDIPVITIDTLHLFDETHNLIDRVRRQYPELKLHVYTPKEHRRRQEFDAAYGADLWKTDPDKYGYLTKHEPTERALDDQNARAWVTGRRRSQGGERVQLPFVEYTDGRIKLNPLAMWSYDDVWKYIRKHKVPYNSLHDQGYKSIGDVMTSRAVDPSAPERSGRFVGLNQTECGMHSHLEKVQKLREKAAQEEQEFVMPTLPCAECQDVDLSNFQADIVQSTERDILLEFYSPLCGACQEFAPTFRRIVAKAKDKVQISRFDITESDLTDEMQEQGFEVEATPTLYLVQHKPLRLTLYEGDHSEFAILDWLEKMTS